MSPLEAAPGLRRFMAMILVLGLVGSGTELMLLDHHEDWKQVIPLGLIAGALSALTWHKAAPGPATLSTLRAVMTLLVLGGLAGVAFHLQGTLEFQREIDPSLSGLDLLMKALRAKAPPALAPGVMIQLGLLGLAFTYRHPCLGAAERKITNNGE